MKSKAVVLYADYKPVHGIQNPGPHQIYCNPQVRLETRTLGKLNNDEIRVEMIYGGLCGSDVHIVEKNAETGYIKSSAPATIPPEGRIIGHEGVGRVLAVGENVRHLKPDAIVTFESIIVCHYCDVCRKGNFNQCRNALLLGLEKDGLFGTIVDVPAGLAHDVTDLAKTDEELKAVACVEPAGVAYVACRNTKVGAGDSVVVFGGGPIGIFCAMLSKNVFGASRVIVVEPVEFRRNLALQWSDEVYGVEEFFQNNLPNVDVLIEASGELRNVTRMFRNVNANGRIAFLARSGGAITLDSLDHMITNAITIVGSRGHLCGAFSDILNLYRQKRLPLGRIVTSVLDGPDALAEILKNTNEILINNCKVLAKFSK